jgi:multiple sugar transport system substrate-binding protein
VSRKILSGRRLGVLAVLATSAITLAACTASPSSNSTTANGKTVLHVAYGSQFVFLTPQLAVKWWGTVAREFEQAHPNVTVQFTPIPGGYLDIVNKMSLLFRTPSTAPDVAELPAGQLGEWSSSGYLLPVNKYLSSATYWADIPKSVQDETLIDGKYYGVNHGENTNALWYNMPMFRKAGLPVPWHPKTWNDVLAAAAKIKATEPSNITPLWLAGGSAGGTIAIQYNGGNLLAGSTNPTIFDAKTGKWVVDSPGLRETLQFYKTLAQKGYQAPVSLLLDPNAVDGLPALLAKNTTAIAVGANFYAESWVKSTCGPCWIDAPKIMGTTELPTINGQAPGYASSLGGWELSIGAQTAHPQLAWDFIQTAQQQTNMVDASNWGGWIPPAATAASSPQFVNYAPPYQAFFAKLLPAAQEEPVTAPFTVWGTAFNNATGAIIQNPNISIDAAINIMKNYMSNQIGADKVEVIH